MRTIMRSFKTAAVLLVALLVGVSSVAKADWPPPPGTRVIGYYKNGNFGTPVDLTVLSPDAKGIISIKSARSGSISTYEPDGAQLTNGPGETFPGGRPYVQKGKLMTGSSWSRAYTQERLNPDTRQWGIQLRSIACKVGNPVLHAGRQAIDVNCVDSNLQESSWRPIDIAMVVDLGTGLVVKITRKNGQNWSPWGDDEMEITQVVVPSSTPAPVATRQ